MTPLLAVVGLAASLSAAPDADANLLRSVQRIAEQFAQTRGTTFAEPPVAVRSPDAMAQVVAEARAYRVVAPQRLEARGRAWNDLGFGGPASPTLLWITLAQDLPGIDLDADAPRLLVSPDVLTQDDYGVVADEKIFVPDGRGGVHEFRPEPEAGADRPEADEAAEFLLATGVRPDEPLLAHYLMHLRQLERNGQDSVRETTDGLLAASAWAEGEANLVSLHLLFRGVGLARTVLTGPVGPGDFLDGKLIPAALGRATPLDAALLSFVYEDGYDFAIGRWREAGWGVFERRPPASTRDLLAPDKPPIELEWPVPVAPAPGMQRVDTDRLGQQSIAALVELWTGRQKLALAASRGWLGDRLVRWEVSPDQGITVWETRWESEADAAEFEQAFKQVIHHRDPDATVVSAPEGILRTRFRRFTVAREAAAVRIEVSAADSEPGSR